MTRKEAIAAAEELAIEVVNAKDLDALRTAIIEMHLFVDSTVADEAGAYVADAVRSLVVENLQYPVFVSENGPEEPTDLLRGLPWWSRDDERILVGYTNCNDGLYFIDYNGDRI